MLVTKSFITKFLPSQGVAKKCSDQELSLGGAGDQTLKTDSSVTSSCQTGLEKEQKQTWYEKSW